MTFKIWDALWVIKNPTVPPVYQPDPGAGNLTDLLGWQGKKINIREIHVV